MTAEISKEDYEGIVTLIREVYGYDFSNYAVSSFRRRLAYFMKSSQIDTIDELRSRLTSKDNLRALLNAVTVNVTDMFRDPAFYNDVRKKVISRLQSYAGINIWHAGCATGEEVFSMAILLHEEGLLERCRIYATDINEVNLEKATSGILPISNMRDYTNNYIQAGGKKDFADYYTARYKHVIINKEIRRQIIFLQHNLVTDYIFNEFQFICCRNVLIYFNRPLQNRALNLFRDSLAPLGYLALGTKESISFSETKNDFEMISTVNKIYRRKT